MMVLLRPCPRKRAAVLCDKSANVQQANVFLRHLLEEHRTRWLALKERTGKALEVTDGKS